MLTLIVLGAAGFYRSPAGQELWRKLTNNLPAINPATPPAGSAPSVIPPAPPAPNPDAAAQRWLDQGYAKEKAGDPAGAIRDYQKALDLTGKREIADRIRQLQVNLNPPPAPDPLPEPGILYKMGNDEAVTNGANTPNRFSTAKSLRITRIMTYHWNDGRGSPPGSISLQHEDGTLYGPWQAAGESGQSGVANAGWIVSPDATIKPGKYTLLDSDPATWSHNAGTKGRGMCAIQGFQEP